MRSKIFKFKQNIRKRWKNRQATDCKAPNVLEPLEQNGPSISQDLKKYLTIVQTIFDANCYKRNCELPYTETIIKERAHRMSASNLYRILSWKKASLSIFDKIFSSQSFVPQSNSYEIELNQQLSKFHIMLEDHGITDFSIAEGPFWYDKERPYLCGTPDFAIFRKDNSTVLVIEAKEIKEASEFDRHCSYLPEGNYRLRHSSEYYHQLRAYITIFKAELGILLIKTKFQYFYVLLAKSEFSLEELDKLKQFYTQFFIPMGILKRPPQLKNGVASYGNEFSLVHLQSVFQNEECWSKLIRSFDINRVPCSNNIEIR